MEISKTHFSTRSGKIMKRMKRKKVDKVAKQMIISVIDVGEKVIDLVPVVLQRIWLTFISNH